MLRDILTRAGGIDRCVSEFIRITDQLPLERVFTRIVPELRDGGRTPAGVPVARSCSIPTPDMADNAARPAGSVRAGIDLNFAARPASTATAVAPSRSTVKPSIVAAVRAQSRPACWCRPMRLGVDGDDARRNAPSSGRRAARHGACPHQAQVYRPPATGARGRHPRGRGRANCQRRSGRWPTHCAASTNRAAPRHRRSDGWRTPTGGPGSVAEPNHFRTALTWDELSLLQPRSADRCAHPRAPRPGRPSSGSTFCAAATEAEGRLPGRKSTPTRAWGMPRRRGC